jgi:hypothetical protein
MPMKRSPHALARTLVCGGFKLAVSKANGWVTSEVPSHAEQAR